MIDKSERRGTIFVFTHLLFTQILSLSAVLRNGDGNKDLMG